MNASEIRRLASDGRIAEALRLLECAADAETLILRALWRLEGRFIARDPVAARADLSAAVELEHTGAARALGALMAVGSGGPRDWRGALALLDRFATIDPLAAQQCELLGAMTLDEDGDPLSLPEVLPIADSPVTRISPGFFSAEECRFLIEQALPRFRPAQIFNEAQRRFIADPVRDSGSAGFPVVFEYPAVHALNRRIARASNTMVEQGEPLQVLRYAAGQQYRPHLDAIPGMANQRILTALIYLNADYEGGETHFVAAGRSIRGDVGDMLIFANALHDGRPDPDSIHAGMPVTEGIKMIASRWIRSRPPNDPHEGFGRQDATGRSGQM